MCGKTTMELLGSMVEGDTSLSVLIGRMIERLDDLEAKVKVLEAGKEDEDKTVECRFCEKIYIERPVSEGFVSACPNCGKTREQQLIYAGKG